MIPSRKNFLPQFSFRFSVCVLVLLFALPAAAQSGRRSTTGSPSVAVPTPTPDLKAEDKAADKKEQRQDIILSSNRGDAFSGVPLYFYDVVLQGCAGRLDDAREVKVEVVQKHTGRAEAINNAKGQKTAYVVWLQLRTDGVNNNTGSVDYGDISIDYTVYEPTTAKVKASGSVYQGPYRNKGVIVGPKTTGGANSAITESRLRDAARDAAERMIRALHLVLPTDMPTH
jgi:hypothetical protein